MVEQVECEIGRSVSHAIGPIAEQRVLPGALNPTPGTLGVSVFLGCSAFRVLYVFLSLFSWWCRGRAGMGGTRVSRRVRRAVPRSAAPGRGRFLLPDGLYPGR